MESDEDSVVSAWSLEGVVPHGRQVGEQHGHSVERFHGRRSWQRKERKEVTLEKVGCWNSEASNEGRVGASEDGEGVASTSGDKNPPVSETWEVRTVWSKMLTTVVEGVAVAP